MQSRGSDQFLTVTPRGAPSRASLNAGPWGMSFEQMFIDVTPRSKELWAAMPCQSDLSGAGVQALRWYEFVPDGRSRHHGRYARMIVGKGGSGGSRGLLTPDPTPEASPSPSQQSPH
eukprot:m51a1_g12443 hypothetical protein (117) ;mRNA; r:848914-849440